MKMDKLIWMSWFEFIGVVIGVCIFLEIIVRMGEKERKEREIERAKERKEWGI